MQGASQASLEELLARPFPLVVEDWCLRSGSEKITNLQLIVCHVLR